MKSIRPKNWAEFQHYKNRCPPWIKLHRGLLDDFEFHLLPVASKALAPLLWLLASEYENGDIPANTRKIAFRFRMPLEDLSVAFEPLLRSGLFTIIGEDDADAIITLAPCKQDALLEGEGETQVKLEEESSSDCCASDHELIKPKNGHEKPTKAAKSAYPDDFETFWRDYPTDRLMSKKNAAAQWSRLTPEDRRTAIASIASFRAYCREHPDYRTVHAERYLSQRRFDGFGPGTEVSGNDLAAKLARMEELNRIN